MTILFTKYLQCSYCVLMKNIAFEWNKKKNQTNQKKHAVSFEEAESVFFDDNAIQFWDENHSESEDRFLMLGMSSKMQILLVVHCYREGDTVIRIISARKATKKEKVEYFGGTT